MERLTMKRTIALLLLSLAGCKVPPAPNPCEPNPCTQPNRTQCAVEDASPRCLCDVGFLQRPSGACEPVGAANCPEHAGDSAEPDDCQLKAKSISPTEAARSQAIEPAGDYDFFTFDATAKNVYVATVIPSGALLARVDLFDQGGSWLGFEERPGTTKLAFRTRSAAPYFLRVMHSPIDPSSGTGTYTFKLEARGPEDYGDDSAEASVQVASGPSEAPTVVSGGFDYAYDEDWFTFNANTLNNYQVAFSTGTGRTLPSVALFTGTDTSTPRWTAQQPTLLFALAPADIPPSGRVHLVLYGPREVGGTYSFTFTRVPR
jgi:hypothetical protein